MTGLEGAKVSTIEQIEMTRYYGELEDDLRHLVNKYCRIMGWEVPELDEKEARKLLFKAMHAALATVEDES
jgi:hypothetical protein